jgi:hypothetical protein
MSEENNARETIYTLWELIEVNPSAVPQEVKTALDQISAVLRSSSPSPEGKRVWESIRGLLTKADELFNQDSKSSEGLDLVARASNIRIP